MAVLLKSFQAVFDRLMDSIDDWRERDGAQAAVGRENKATRAYTINCTGDVVLGDEVMFVRAIWEKKAINSYGKLANVIVDYELFEGKVVKESYGAKRGQHTFSIKRKHDLLLIKGRNLYSIGVWRKKWPDENKRRSVADEKHERGAVVRSERRKRQSY